MNAKMREYEEARKEAFLNNIDNPIKTNDAWYPHITLVKETPKGYTRFMITQYPTGAMLYEVSMYNKVTLDSYRHKQYYYGDIPATHKAQFEALEQLFN